MKLLAVCLAVLSGSLLGWSATAFGAGYNVYVCGPWSASTGPFVGSAVAPHTTFSTFACGGGGDANMNLQGNGGNPGAPNGQSASWTATAPTGLSITHIYTENDSSGNVGDGHGWWGEFFWNGGPGLAGRSAQLTDTFSQYGCCQASFDDRTVGWFLTCGVASCTQPADINVGGVALAVTEEQGPWLVSPAGLWQVKGYVRGAWPVPFAGDSPSGVCSLSASFNGQPLALGAASAVARNSGTWHQCAGATANPTVQTADYGSGPLPLTIGGCDAAGACTGNAFTKMIYVDNTRPTISLSGPTDAPSTTGTQLVTATASAGPSGVDGISCSVDDGPPQWHWGSTAPVPVAGLGVHSVSCSAANNAVDPAGNHGWSSAGSWSLKIGDPTVSGIAFGHIVDALRCESVRQRVEVPAHWVTVKRHHIQVKVKRRASVKIKSVTKCHPRTKLERVAVRVRVRRHGKTVWIIRHKRRRVVVPPHLRNSTELRIRHGHTATVSGWLGNYAGVALGGQPVTVLTAPNNGLGRFVPAAVVATAPNGSWTTTLPAGPSRLVEAVFNGGPTTEASTSGQVRLVVPSKLAVKLRPARVRWGNKIVISGHILGGYIPSNPQAVSQLLRLRIGIRGIHISQTAGIPDVDRAGNFRTSYCFGTGRGVVHYWFSVSTLREVDYPFHSATSRRIPVQVGPRNARRPCH